MSDEHSEQPDLPDDALGGLPDARLIAVLTAAVSAWLGHEHFVVTGVQPVAPPVPSAPRDSQTEGPFA